jgi:hypothetical protein
MPTARRPCRPRAARVCMMSCAASNVHACTQVGYVDGTKETKALKEWLRPGGALPPAARLVRPSRPPPPLKLRSLRVVAAFGRPRVRLGRLGGHAHMRRHPHARRHKAARACAHANGFVHVQTTRPHAQNTHACDLTLRTSTNARTDAALARTQANKPASGVLNIPSEEFSKNWKLPPDFESANWLWKARIASFATCDSRRPRVACLRASFPYALVACLIDCADAIRSRLL